MVAPPVVDDWLSLYKSPSPIINIQKPDEEPDRFIVYFIANVFPGVKSYTLNFVVDELLDA